MEFGLKIIRKNWFIWFHEFFWHLDIFKYFLAYCAFLGKIRENGTTYLGSSGHVNMGNLSSSLIKVKTLEPAEVNEAVEDFVDVIDGQEGSNEVTL